ncbi:hypothetical protein Vadar_023113 [Vaccinium darrowii]|uniref:Uncharacterized protein n=1 Tax=Vaccinium darrowii TaxID=229202 RepID=A0ACB7ZDR8_9ERIC|nr:hypothetical protein Vadar_023113 [Vaccinium darrowii]
MSILSIIHNKFSKKTTILGLRLWILIAISVGAIIALILFLCCLCRRRCRRKSPKPVHSLKSSGLIHNHESLTPAFTKEIEDIVPEVTAPNHRLHEVQIKVDKAEDRELLDSDRMPSSGESPASIGAGPPPPPIQGWMRRYTLREIEVATKGLSDESVIGKRGYGTVYRGLLGDNTIVAVKNLFNDSGQAEKEFQVEVAVIGRVKHKNLVRLLGYCAEGAYRMLVYEYVENGNLDYWLHRDVGLISPLTWNIRMDIILGTAKGLAYLHDSLEPKVIHRDIKSSNILLDRQWKPKVSDFGLAKLLCSENTHVTTRVMGTDGYVAPEYTWTGMLNEMCDVYSFGIVVMEIISGRLPVDNSRLKGQVNLIDWFKKMVENQNFTEVVDPELSEMPALKALKQVLLVALLCVDPNASERPKMRHVIRMLEAANQLDRHEKPI